MTNKPTEDEFDASWFYGLAAGAAVLLGLQDLAALFVGEAILCRCIAAYAILMLGSESSGDLVDGLHTWFVERLGPLTGVVTTMLLVVVLVRGSLMIAVRAAGKEHSGTGTSASSKTLSGPIGAVYRLSCNDLGCRIGLDAFYGLSVSPFQIGQMQMPAVALDLGRSGC